MYIAQNFISKHSFEVLLGLHLGIIRKVLAIYPKPIDDLSQLFVWRVLQIFNVFEVPVEASEVLVNLRNFFKRPEFHLVVQLDVIWEFVLFLIFFNRIC